MATEPGSRTSRPHSVERMRRGAASRVLQHQRHCLPAHLRNQAIAPEHGRRPEPETLGGECRALRVSVAAYQRTSAAPRAPVTSTAVSQSDRASASAFGSPCEPLHGIEERLALAHVAPVVDGARPRAPARAPPGGEPRQPIPQLLAIPRQSPLRCVRLRTPDQVSLEHDRRGADVHRSSSGRRSGRRPPRPTSATSGPTRWMRRRRAAAPPRTNRRARGRRDSAFQRQRIASSAPHRVAEVGQEAAPSPRGRSASLTSNDPRDVAPERRHVDGARRLGSPSWSSSARSAQSEAPGSPASPRTMRRPATAAAAPTQEN